MDKRSARGLEPTQPAIISRRVSGLEFNDYSGIKGVE